MPQMFPMNWLLNYITFIISFLLYMIKIYLSLFQKLPNKSMQINLKKMNWKW